MSANDTLAATLKRIVEDNDFRAVDDFREQVQNKQLVLYSEDQENFDYTPLFYHGEPIFHTYALSPLKCEIGICQLLRKIGKNDFISFALNEAEVSLHPFSKLVYKSTENKHVIFPKTVPKQNDCVIGIGDFVEYNTEVDQKNHYGKVFEILQGMLLVKEYAGFWFSFEGCEFTFQDRGNWKKEYTVCVPADACKPLDKNDSRIQDMLHSSIIGSIWKNRIVDEIDKFREWFTAKSKSTVVYYLECDGNRSLSECPFLFVDKESAERAANKKSSQTICAVCAVKIPDTHSFVNAFIMPNTDGAAKQMGAKVSYYKENWNVVKTTIAELIAKYPGNSIKFGVEELLDFSGDPVYNCSVDYCIENGSVSTHYSDADGRIDITYPMVIDIGNTVVPNVADVVSCQDYTHPTPVIAKVTAISGPMIRVKEWKGIYYQNEFDYTYDQDDWSSTSYVFIPLSSCRLIPNINLSVTQFEQILRFEEGNKLTESPWANYSIKEKAPFDIEDILLGLENLRSRAPEMVVRWISFVSSEFIDKIDSEIQSMSDQHIEKIERTDHPGGDDCFKQRISNGEIDFIQIIDDMIDAINLLYFSEDCDEYDDRYDYLYDD